MSSLDVITARLGLQMAHGRVSGRPHIDKITARSTVTDVAYVSLRRHLRSIIEHEPGARLGEDIEELHRMRVSVRRLRAVLKMFSDYVPKHLEELRPRFGWVGRVLGGVRDLDVQIERLDEWRDRLNRDDRPALTAVEDLLRALREQARQEMLAQLDTAGYARLMDRTAAMLCRQIGAPGPGQEPAVNHAPRIIEEAYQSLVRAGLKIDARSSPNRYHRLRARCKTLRYALEVHTSLYGKPAKKMTRALVRLQDLLGEHQDAFVALTRLRELRKSELPAHTTFVLGSLASHYDVHAADLRQRFPSTFKTVTGKKWQRLKRSMGARRVK